MLFKGCDNDINFKTYQSLFYSIYYFNSEEKDAVPFEIKTSPAS